MRGKISPNEIDDIKVEVIEANDDDIEESEKK